MVSALDKILTPVDPVSTNRPSTVWQVDVPGTHTVTLANAPSAYAPAGPEFTVMGATLFVVPLVPFVGVLAAVWLLLLPPHAKQNANVPQSESA